MHNRSTLRAGIALAALALAAAAPTLAQNATGKPVIAGKPQVGHTLLGVVRGISDPELSGTGPRAIPGLRYQWAHIDGTAETPIAGATGRTHRMAAADQGKRMGLRVSFTDDRGNRESVLSDATDPVAAAEADPDCQPPDFGSREVVWAATASIMATAAGHAASPDNRATRLGGSDNEVETVELHDLPGGANGLALALKNPVVVNTSLTAALIGHEFELHIVCGGVDKLSLADSGESPVNPERTALWFNPGLDWSGVTERVMYLSLPANDVARGQLPISGTVEAGGTLTTSLSLTGNPGIAELNGVHVPSVTFRWYRWVGGALTPVSTTGGSESSSYAVARDDLGRRLRAGVSFYDQLGNLEERASGWLPPPPTLHSSVLAVDGTTLTLTYDGDLDEGSVPPAGAFTVKVGGAARPLAAAAPVAVSGRAVVLTLAEPAHAGEAVTVAYDKPTPPPPPPQSGAGAGGASVGDGLVPGARSSEGAPP